MKKVLRILKQIRDLNLGPNVEDVANESLHSKKLAIEAIEYVEAGAKSAAQPGVVINRIWAMPNRWTFKIKPIAEIVKRYVGSGVGWIDPFAGMNSPAEITNDLNPERQAIYHLHAKDFALSLDAEYNGVLFDPPYSLRQVRECYDEMGIALLSQEDTNLFPNNIKEIIAPKIREGGHALSFGWNTIGFGIGLGFKLKEILLVCHGGKHNDTIVTVEEKQVTTVNMFEGKLFNFANCFSER